MKKMDESLGSALVESSVMDHAVDAAKVVAELALDASFDEGLLREIPVFSWLVAACRIVTSVRDRLFMKKVALFLANMEMVPEETKQKFLRELDSKRGGRKDLGEKLILLLDRMNDFEKARLLGMLFRAYIRGEWTRDEFDYVSDAVDMLNPSLLVSFAAMPPHQLDKGDGLALVTVGLADVDFAIEGINDGFRQEHEPVGHATPEFKKSALGEKFSALLQKENGAEPGDG
jgi:hypothetical protein